VQRSARSAEGDCDVGLAGSDAGGHTGAEMITTDVFDDCQAARAVTSCVVPFDIIAVAVSCDVWPTAGAVPEIVTAVTVSAGGGFVVETLSTRRCRPTTMLLPQPGRKPLDA